MLDLRKILAEDLREIRRLLAYHEEKTQQLREEEKRIINTLEILNRQEG